MRSVYRPISECLPAAEACHNKYAIKARPSFPRRFDADTRNRRTHVGARRNGDKQLEAPNDWSYHRRHAFQRVVSVHREATEKDSACPENSPKRLRASRKMNYSGIVSGMLSQPRHHRRRRQRRRRCCCFEERRRSLSLGIWSVDIGADGLLRRVSETLHVSSAPISARVKLMRNAPSLNTLTAALIPVNYIYQSLIN